MLKFMNMLLMKEVDDCVPHFLSLLNSSLPVSVHQRANRLPDHNLQCPIRIYIYGRWSMWDHERLISFAFFRCSIVLPIIETRIEEEKHPLAFSIIAHRDARSLKSWQMNVRLLISWQIRTASSSSLSSPGNWSCYWLQSSARSTTIVFSLIQGFLFTHRCPLTQAAVFSFQLRVMQPMMMITV